MRKIQEKYWTIPLIYLLIGALWILISDGVVFLENAKEYSLIQTFKGIFFVFITAFLLHILLRIYFQKLERSEREYRYLFEENPSPYYVVEQKNRRILAINKAFEEFYGFRKEQLIGLSENKLEIRNPHGTMSEKGQVKIALHKNSKGGTFYVKLLGKLSEFNGVTAEIIMVTDFDREFKAQLELKETRHLSESQQRYLQSLADSNRLFLLRFLQDGSLLYANTWALQWLRKATGQQEMGNLFESLSPNSVNAIEQCLQQCRKFPGKLFPLSLEEPDGAGNLIYIDWEFNGIVNPAGHPMEFQALGIEVTEKIVSLKEKAMFKVRLESILQNIEGVIFALDIPSLKLNYVSPSVEKLLGGTVQEYLDNPQTWSNIILEEDRPAVFEVLDELLSGSPGSTASGEYRIQDRDGHIKWVSNKAIFVTDPILNTPMVSGIITDITHLKEAEQEISKRNEKLREIARIQSHALRGPLSSILGLMQLFDKEGLNVTLNKEVITHLETKAKELDGVIHDIVHKAWELEKEHAEPETDATLLG